MQPAQPVFPPLGSDYRISDTDDLLNRIGESLQLNATQRKLADQRYKSVAEWIETDDEFFKDVVVSIYAQGSFRIGTMVRPYKQKEFDLDFVVHIEFLSGKIHNPIEILNQLERRLRAHDIYKQMLDRKNRCMRITYANDFHMDIMVGCEETYQEPQRIVVPDRKTKEWTPSNPIGYAHWFLSRSQLVAEQYARLYKAYEVRNMELRSSEDLPVERSYEFKLPLERAVQILKRYRDVYFYNNPDFATSSIILTTLAAEAYGGQLSVFEAIDGIINTINQKATNFYGRVAPFKIPNPANPDENFSEKWFEDHRLFDEFLAFIKDVKRTWDTLKSATNSVLRENILKQAFGESRVTRLMGEQRDYQTKAGKVNRLTPIAQAAGLGSLHTTPSVKPTFEKTPVQNQPARRYGGKAFPLTNVQYSAGTNYLQERWIEETYPGIFSFNVRNGVLTCKGKIRPTDDCDEYRITIQYVSGKPPRVYINSHRIKSSRSIHMYSDGSLCLHYPPDIKWKHRTSVANFTIPWTAEWIVCYELWKITGKWEGSAIKH
ncbi:nucleotidyltransferase domain-containing protein [Spirosoma gilvum]